MAHAGEEEIRGLEDVLAEIRSIQGLVEKPKPGLFKYRSQAFLHFHRFGDKLCFDVKTANGDRRVDVPTQRDATIRRELVRQVREALESLT